MDFTKGKVSVIVPAYNAEKFIERCIDSILNQSYKNREIIVVNDGSTDKTLPILRRYSEAEKIILIDIPNGGVVNARNIAVNHASGEFLAFVDADDYIIKDAISLMVQQMADNNADLVVAGYTLLWEDGRRKDINNKKNFSSPDKCISYCLKNGETFLPVKMYRTELYKRTVNIPYDITMMEDTVGILQYLRECRKVATLDKSVYVYYKNAGSASMSISSKSVVSMLLVSQFLLEYSSHSINKCGRILQLKCRDILFDILGNLQLIPDHLEQYKNIVIAYTQKFGFNTSFKDLILKWYTRDAKAAISGYRRAAKYSTYIFKLKKFIRLLINIRIIHR